MDPGGGYQATCALSCSIRGKPAASRIWPKDASPNVRLGPRRSANERLWPLQAALDGLRGNIRKFEEIGTQAAAAGAAVIDALDFHEAIGVEPGQTWGLATFAIDGVNAAALVPQLFEHHRIVGSAAVNQGLPGPVIDFSGVRVTSQIYATLADIDRFVVVVSEILKA